MPGFVKYFHIGWAIYSSQQPVVDSENRGWQLYISVKPNEKNLKAALAALDELVMTEQMLTHPRHPTIKVALPENSDLHPHYFDAALPPPSADIAVADQDQMGREICVSLDYDSHKRNYTFNPSAYMELMLKIWKKLEENGVELNYTTPEIDELIINCDDEILTPFSYSARKNPHARHGLLFASEANPNRYDDPLIGLRITREDLLRHEIEGGAAPVVCFKRIYNLKARLKTAKLAISTDLNAFFDAAEPEPNCQTVLQKLQAIVAIKENEAFIAACDELFNNTAEWAPFLPHKPNGAMEPAFNEKQIWLCSFRINDIQAKAKILRKQLVEIIEFSIQEIDDIKKIDFNEKTAIQAAQDRAIERNPALAQRLYRRMVHIINIGKLLFKEKDRLTSYRKFPDSYQRIWDQTPSDILDKTRAILRDYTQDNNKFMLYFKGHWGRTSSQISEVQRIIDNVNELNDFHKIMSRLYDIPLKDSGSLGCRMAFIQQKHLAHKKLSSKNKEKPSYRS